MHSRATIGPRGRPHRWPAPPPCPMWASIKIRCGDIEQCRTLRKVSATSQFGTPNGVLHCSMSPQWFFQAHIVRGGGPGHLCFHPRSITTRIPPHTTRWQVAGTRDPHNNHSQVKYQHHHHHQLSTSTSRSLSLVVVVVVVAASG